MAPGRNVGSEMVGTTDRLLGELIAEVRNVKHNQNNTNQKLDAVGHLVEQVKEIREEQGRQNARILILEADKNRREGAINVFEWLSRHWPFAIIMTGLAALIAWANGRLHP